MNKKHTFRRALAVTGILAATCTSSFAYTVTMTAGTYQSGVGGEFKATVSDNSLSAYISSYAASTATGNSFQTFCIEYNEHFNYNTPYAAEVSDAAKKGNTTTQDPISLGTGWLYSRFAEATLAGYNFSGTQTQRRASAAALQSAFWWLEGERSAAQLGFTVAANYLTSSNPFIQLVMNQFGATNPLIGSTTGGSGGAANDDGSTYGVFALNLGPFSGNSTVRQDQLIYRQPAAQVAVPDGGTNLLLLGMGLTGLAGLQRKMRKAA